VGLFYLIIGYTTPWISFLISRECKKFKYLHLIILF
jgi:hypothetical protein